MQIINYNKWIYTNHTCPPSLYDLNVYHVYTNDDFSGVHYVVYVPFECKKSLNQHLLWCGV